MSIPIKFYTAVLKKSVIRTQYPGGFETFLEDRQQGLPEDEELIGVIFMGSGELQQFLDMLHTVGFDLKNGCAVGEMILGVVESCPGIEFRAGDGKGILGPGFIAYSSEVNSSEPGERKRDIKITRLKIGLLPNHCKGAAPEVQDAKEYNYWAEAIEEDDGKFYYRVTNKTIEITEDQFRKVIDNPHLHYFSTALKLHEEIKRMRKK